jgi:hypothetical protein
MSNSLEQLKAAGTVSSSHLDPVIGDTTLLSNNFSMSENTLRGL